MTDFLSALADQSLPPERVSRWYCDRASCDGEPHDSWHWCGHPLAGPHKPDCRHARTAQRPPEGDWFVWMLLTGRGFGKSRAAAEWLVDSALEEVPGEWCVIARNTSDVRKNARDMTAGIVAVAKRGDGSGSPKTGYLKQYNRHEEDIYLTNGAVIHCLSADKPDRLRGFNLMGCWADELASWRYMEETWDYGLLPALRSGRHPRVVVTTTPKPVPLLKRLVEEAKKELDRPERARSKVMTTGSTWENAKNLADNFIEEMRSSFEGTRIGRQELEGELIFDLSGALVSAEMIEAARVEFIDPADLVRVIVAIDPAGTYGDTSDETGIVVCAKGQDGQGYVLADRSCKVSPREWATIAAACYDQYQADAIVAEKNMGHDLVEEVVRTAAPHVRYIPVQATTAKRLRAEPVTALYEQGRIHHVGVFARLEEQLCTWTPDMAMRNTRGNSPDRMDAMVHGMTELGLVRWGVGQGWMQAFRNLSKSDEQAPERRNVSVRSFFFDEPPKAVEPSLCPGMRIFGPEKRCVHCGAQPETHGGVSGTADLAPQRAH